MKTIQSILGSPDVAKKLDLFPNFQLDNPITTKKQVNANGTRNILRKRISNRIKPTPELVQTLQNAARSYQESASSSEVQFLKSDFHGVEMCVKKAKCYSFVGLKGIVIKETFSTFVLVDSETNTKTSVVPKAGCIFSVRRNSVIQFINGDQLLCNSGMRTTKKIKSKPSFYL